MSAGNSRFKGSAGVLHNNMIVDKIVNICCGRVFEELAGRHVVDSSTTRDFEYVHDLSSS